MTDADLSKGLYRKFTVERTDGSSKPGGKHENCEYFVLDMDHDPHARAAISGYVASLKAAGVYLKLARDLERKYLRKHP